MKTLIITNDLPPYLNANSAIIYRIAEVLQQTYHQEIIILGLQTAPENCLCPYPDFQTISIESQYRYTNFVPAHLRKFHKVLRILSHPSIWLMTFRYHFMRHPFYGIYKRKLHNIVREIPDLDCIIATSDPVDIPRALTKIHLNIPWISYRLDPWATHYLRRNNKSKAEEDAANKACSAVFVPPAIYQEYLDGSNSIPLDKLHEVEFPNLRPLPQSKFQTINWSKERIHCAYIGQLYSDIRSPSFMLELFAAMRDAGIVLHIVGNSTVQANYWQEKISDNIILHGRVPYEESISLMQSADILVNLGNTILNQLPSKIIDYLSTGKPILNLYKIDGCPTLSYMKKHPAALSIYEGHGIDMDSIHQVINFCKEYQGYEVPFLEMEKIYKKCTPEYVGARVYDILCRISQKK